MPIQLSPVSEEDFTTSQRNTVSGRPAPQPRAWACHPLRKKPAAAWSCLPRRLSTATTLRPAPWTTECFEANEETEAALRRLVSATHRLRNRGRGLQGRGTGCRCAQRGPWTQMLSEPDPGGRHCSWGRGRPPGEPRRGGARRTFPVTVLSALSKFFALNVFDLFQ